MRAFFRSGLERDRENLTGAAGFMTAFLGWRQAFKSAVMVRDRSGVSRWNHPPHGSLPAFPAACFGRRRGRRHRLGVPSSRPICRSRRPSIVHAFDSSGFHIGGHTGYSRGSSNAVLIDPLQSAAFNGTYSGVIGGVQAGDLVRLLSGLLLGVEADLTFPNICPRTTIISRLPPRLRRHPTLDYVGTAARPHRLRAGPWLLTRPAGSAFAGERFVSTPRRRRGKAYLHAGSAGPPAPALNTPSRRTGACGSNISTASSARADVRFPSGAQYPTLDFQSCVSASTASSTGRDRQNWTPNTTSPIPNPTVGRFTAS